MDKNILLAILAIAVLALGVWLILGERGEDNQGILPYESGITGTVLLSPICPVETVPPDPSCAPRPYSTLVAVFRTSDLTHAIALSESDKEGKFSFSLPPGEYSVGAGESALPSCEHVRVTVGPNTRPDIIIDCDTGIR